MKEKVIYKSNSFSIYLFIFFIGFVLFSLMIWFTLGTLKNNDDDKTIVYIIDFIFLLGAAGSLFYFLKTQRIKITENHLIVSYQFLPFSKKVLLNEIKGFKQIPRPVKYSKGSFDKAETVHTIFETFIILKNDKKIRTYSLNDFEFKEVRKLVENIKRGENKLEVNKLTSIEFIIENIPIILFLIICIFLILGLSNALINKSMSNF